MNRVIICALILTVVTAGSVWSLFELRQTTYELCKEIEICKEYVIMDSFSDGDRLEDFEKYWKKYYKKASFITRSASLEEIAVSASRLAIMSDKDELTSELESIRQRAVMIYDQELPHARSIF